MRVLKRNLWLSFVSSFICSLILRPAIADELVVKRLLSEAPTAWNEIYQAYDGTEFEVALSVETANRPELRLIVSQSDGNMRIEYKSDQATRVSLLNKNYQATVVQRRNGEWFIAKCEPSVPVGNHDFVVAHPSLRVIMYDLPKQFLGLETFAENNQSAMVLRDAWERIDSGGHGIVTAEFLPAIRDEENKFVVNEKITNGYVCRVDFSPRRSWCIVGVEFSSPAIQLSEKSVLTFSSPGPHPSEIQIFKGTGDGKEPKFAYREVFSELRKKSVQAAQFRVSSFGLKEPAEFDRAEIVNWKQLFLVLGCLVGCYIIVHLFRNKTQK
jgi:hypothetical protein